MKKLTIFDNHGVKTSILKEEFKNHPEVEIVCADFRDLRGDILVSPANSFGFMDGGIDKAYTDHYGPGLQTLLQRKIVERKFGELLVGDALGIFFNEIKLKNPSKFVMLLAAPTMRTPRIKVDLANIFIAARRVFQSSPEVHISMPGMGMGSTGLKWHDCAYAMRRAYEAVKQPESFPAHWKEELNRMYKTDYVWHL